MAWDLSAGRVEAKLNGRMFSYVYFYLRQRTVNAVDGLIYVIYCVSSVQLAWDKVCYCFTHVLTL